MGSGSGPRVLIVDCDARARASLARSLERAGLESVQASDGGHALELVSAELPAAIVLDVDLGDMDGFEVCRELRDRYGEELPIVLVSAKHVDAHDRIAGLLVGGDDYLVKPIPVGELIARLRRLIARSRLRLVRPAALATPLTTRELEVLRLLVQGLDAAAIAGRLVISPKTVSSHLQHLMAKLGVHSRAQAVSRAYETGLIDLPRFDAPSTPVRVGNGAVPAV